MPSDKHTEQLNFTCQRCGACCKLVGAALPYLPSSYYAIFHPGPDGACRHLKTDGGKYKCDIYERRPALCREVHMAKRRAIQMGISDAESLAITQRVCDTLRMGASRPSVI